MTVKRVTIVLIGDDSQLQRVLDDVRRQKLEIARPVNLRVNADVRSALLQLAELKRQLDEIKRKQDEIKLKGILGRLGSGGGGGGGSRGGFFGTILTSVNSLLQKIPVVGGALESLSPGALPVIAGAFIALGAAIGSILGPLTAATIGLGSLAVLSIPALKQISAGVRAVDAETTKLGQNRALQSIPAAFRPAVSDIVQMRDEFDKMSMTISPLVGKVIGLGTQIAKHLLPDLKPFAERAGSALEGLLRQFDKFTQSPGFKSFESTMLRFTGPAITEIGQGLGQVLGALGDELKQLTSGKSLIVLKATFIALAGTIRVVGQALKHAVDMVFMFGNASLTAMHAGIVAAKAFGDAWLKATSITLHAMSHIPGLGFLKRWASEVDTWKSSFDSSMNGAIGKIKDWQTALKNAPKIVEIKADISNLQSRLEAARSALRDPTLTATRKAKINADISNLQMNIARARAELQALNGAVVTTYISTIRLAGGTGGSGGHPLQSPAATGGYRSGRTLVGERGPEIADLPPGSYIHTAAATRRIMAAAGYWHHMRPPHEMRRSVRYFRDERMTPGGYSGDGPPRFHMDAERKGAPVHYHINFNGVVTDPAATARKIRQMLLDLKRSTGTLGLA